MEPAEWLGGGCRSTTCEPSQIEGLCDDAGVARSVEAPAWSCVPQYLFHAAGEGLLTPWGISPGKFGPSYFWVYFVMRSLNRPWGPLPGALAGLVLGDGGLVSHRAVWRPPPFPALKGRTQSRSDRELMQVGCISASPSSEAAGPRRPALQGFSRRRFR